MSIKVQWNRECQFKVTTEGGFSFDIDATSNTAPCPTEVLLSALGGCSATDVVLLLQEKGFEVEALENSVTHTLTDDETSFIQNGEFAFYCEGEGCVRKRCPFSRSRSRCQALSCLFDASTYNRDHLFC
ncbi:OsmC family protein [Vibrio sp. ED004]|uniref:OsmC family protein n=1 Tax=Vibrio sp. ED004 TaxID=2785124 RepID=UPI0020C0B784|nr:OsmC family protein [Vibrio sp. ED004]